MSRCVHFRIIHPAGNMMLEPTVQYPGPVDAQQRSVPRLGVAVIDMDKRIDPRFFIITGAIRDAIHHPGRPGGRGDIARFQYAQRKRVIGLVPGTIRHRSPGFKPQFSGSRRRQLTVNGKGILCRRNDSGVKPERRHHFLGQLFVGKVPENPL